MRAEVAAALTRSAAAFRDLVWPVICTDLGGGDLVPVESVSAGDFAKQLDTLAGVDAWQIIRESGMRPIASRVQTNTPRIDTFTIRWTTASGSPTEIDKRIVAIRDGYLYPSVTVQAYLVCPHGDFNERCRCSSWLDHRLVSVASVDTVILFEFASSWRSRHGSETDYWRVRDGAWVKDVERGNRMLVIPWSLLPDAQSYRIAA